MCKKTNMFKREIGEIYRLKVPFEEVYTSVFLIKRKGGNVLVDCATSKWDVDTYVLPALKAEGVSASEIKYLVLTHSHCDHAGGRDWIVELNPRIEIINEEGKSFQDSYTVSLTGHTLDSVGVLDLNTNTLIAGDGLQGYGIGKYGCTIEGIDEYECTVKGLKNNKRIENLLLSHAFSPWGKDRIFGRKSVLKCLDDCLNYVKEKK